MQYVGKGENMITASILFAQGKTITDAPNRCYYCGAPCGDEHHTSDYVKDTFTNRDIVKYPGSAYVCTGCVQSMGHGDDKMLMIDGSVKVRENSRGMQPRMYSWILTKDKKFAATKAHIALLREAILNPPEPPFAIILADSGQKQLIFRAPVAMSREVFPVMLEDDVIEVSPERLLDRLTLALPIVAALGKPALLGEITMSSCIQFEKYHGNIDALEKWLEVKNEPLSRLAAWLSKNKEDAQNEHQPIERGTVQTEISRTDRPEAANAGNGAGGAERRDDQIRLEFSEPVRG
jgi:CRISPR type IV-associated protein Csf1